MVTGQGPELPRPIVLTEVAYVSSFHTSVASLDRLLKMSTGTKDQGLTQRIAHSALSSAAMAKELSNTTSQRTTVS